MIKILKEDLEAGMKNGKMGHCLNRFIKSNEEMNTKIGQKMFTRAVIKELAERYSIEEFIQILDICKERTRKNLMSSIEKTEIVKVIKDTLP